MASRVEDLLDQIRRDQDRHLDNLHDDMLVLIAHVRKLKGGGGSAGAGAAKDAGGVLGQLGEVAGALGEMAGVVAVVVGALLAIPAALTALTFAAVPFVNALSPSTVDAFNRQLDNLMATIGEGLVPIITYATASVREWAGILLPTIRELKPEIEKLASAFSGLMAGGVRLFAASVTLLVRAASPLIDSFAQWVEMAGQALEGLAALVSAFGDSQEIVDGLGRVLEGVLSTGLTELGVSFGSLRDIVGKAVIGLGILAAGLLKIAGATDTLNKFKASLAKTIADRKNPAPGLNAAPKDSTVGGIEDIAKKMTERAFVATAGGTASRSTDDLLTEMLGLVEFVSEINLVEVIAEGIKKGLPGSETARAAGDVVATVRDASAASSDRFKAGREAGGLVGGAAAVAAGKLGDWF